MSKQAGLLQNFYVDGYDLSGDVGSIESADSIREQLGVTGIDKRSQERIYGRRDGALTFVSYFNPTAGQSHPVLSAQPPVADVNTIWACAVDTDGGLAVGDPALAMVGKQANYDGSDGTDGSLTFTTTVNANSYGAEWGRLLTAGIASQGSAGSLAAYDNGVETDFGLQAYLQVFNVTGTSITVAIEESSDDAAADAYAPVTGATFSAVTSGAAPTGARLQTARTATIERYLRVTTTGTFTAATFAVTVIRNTGTVNLP